MALLVRDPAGDHLLAIHDEASAQTLIFSPPALSLPADLTVGRSWESHGMLGEIDYVYTGEVLTAAASHTTPLGAYGDCVQMKQRLLLTRAGESLQDQTDHVWMCAQVGTVTILSTDATGTPTKEFLLVAATTLPDAIRDAVAARPNLLPPLASLPAPTPVASTAPWTWERVGRALPVGQTGASTIQPVYMPGEPPLLLAAGYQGDLVAFDASSIDGDVRWRFHPGATIYGRPGYDPQTGIIYVGASDKHLYALNPQGLFLWSRAIGDNLATMPLVVADTVIVGGEDRSLYGFHAKTGALRWQRSTGGPVVASPVLAGDVVAIGADDGAVYALDPATGTERWLYDAGAPVEAPLVAAEGVIYVAGRNNVLVALAARDGRELWTAATRYALRTAPAVDADQVYVVDEFGDLTAFPRATGQRRWTVATLNFVGPATVVDDAIFAVAGNGVVHQLDQQGQTVTVWSPSADDPAQYALGASLGGGALWLADTNAVIRRLGPARLAQPLPTLAWARSWSDAPFQHSPFVTTPATDGERFYLLDEGNTLYTVQPATGETEIFAHVDATASTVSAPLVHADQLFVAVGDQLAAYALSTGALRWQQAGEGMTLHPPVAADDDIYWLTQTDDSIAWQLTARDVKTGDVHWQQEGGPVAIIGSLAVDATSIYLSTPPSAWDRQTGVLRWSLADQIGLGLPRLSDDGGTLFVGLIHADMNQGMVAALDPADGSRRWETPLPSPVGPLDSLWQHGDLLIVPLYFGTGDLVGLDVADGSLRWQYHPPLSRLGSVALINGRIWVPLQDGRVVLLDAHTGEKIATLGDAGGNLNSNSYAQRPAAVDGSVLVPLADRLWGMRLEE